MQVMLYNNSSDARRLSKNINLLATANCQLKDDCSLLRPRLVINHSTLSAYANCNYMYIPDFRRYYYCNVSALPGDMLELTGDVDVLMSYASGIRSIRCTIIRQEKVYNPYIVDNFMPSRAQRNIQRISVGTYNAGVGLYLTVDGGKDNV